MGFGYLNGKLWSQVTRDERFFCQRLYELVNSKSVEEFAQIVSRVCGLDLPKEGEWEIGFEVCFYRDLWHLRGNDGRPFSQKRTFDLCLFNESAIVIIEAKAAEGFGSDQNEAFKQDISEVQDLTQLPKVYLVGLCSSKYTLDPGSKNIFGERVLRWNDLAEIYWNDEILNRADEVYQEREAFANHGQNSDVRLSGSALVEAFQDGKRLWVGRGGGVLGSRFREDVKTGRWKTQVYEVNSDSDISPSSNFFSLQEFVEAVRGG